MPRNTNPLTNTQIDKAKPKVKEYNLADGDGLYLRLKPNGSKLWLLKYSRPYTKSRTNIGFAHTRKFRWQKHEDEEKKRGNC